MPQSITIRPASTTLNAPAGSPVNFDLIYESTPPIADLSTLTTNLFYSSADLQLPEGGVEAAIANTFADPTIPPLEGEDTEDADNNPDTDRVISITWTDIAPPPTLPGEVPQTLFNGVFQTTPNFDGGQVNFQAVTTPDAPVNTQPLQITAGPVTPPPTGGEGANLVLNPNKIFTLQGGNSTVLFDFEGADAGFVNQVGVVRTEADGSINGVALEDPNAPSAEYIQAALEEGDVIFSALADPPLGFDPATVERLLSFNAGENLLFYLVPNDSTEGVLSDLEAGAETPNVFFATSNNLQIEPPPGEANPNGIYRLLWEDLPVDPSSDFNDLVMNIRTSDRGVSPAADLQTDVEVLDLRNQTAPVNFTATVGREALFNNTVGFYRVSDPLTGEINGVAPDSEEYLQAVLENRVEGLNFATADQQPSTVTGTLEAGAAYAPFIVSNGTIEQLLDGDTTNDPTVFFPYLPANPEGVDHLRLLSDNTFGFEDIVGGGDADFNDVTVQFGFA